jgi:citrate lyase subunit beta/citryl-CoA lyase
MAKRGEAGRREKGVRSDCWVSVELTDSGGLDVKITSKVDSMYGESIRQLCLEELKAFKIKHAKVEVQDFGAVPFIMTARIEAAVKRAGIEVGNGYLLPMAEHCMYSTTRERFRRSRLYLPGNEPRFFLNAGIHKPDGIILDLEDAVAPSEKDAAQVLVRNALRQVNFYGAERMVRINQIPRGLEDLEYIVPNNVHVVLIPKCESAEQVKAVDEKIAELLSGGTPDSTKEGYPPLTPPPHSRGGIEPDSTRPPLSPPSEGVSSDLLRSGGVFLMPIIESGLGAIKAYEIATACEAVVALAIGLEDYTADIGVQRTLEGKESFWMRSQIVNAARAAKVQPIDTVFSDVNDMEGLRLSVLEAKALGFDGKGCIHPRQIAVVHEAFAPDPKEINKAVKIVKAYEEAQAKGLGVVALGSKMIDPPVVKRALRTVELAVGTGKLSPEWRKEVSVKV